VAKSEGKTISGSISNQHGGSNQLWLTSESSENNQSMATAAGMAASIVAGIS